MPAARPLPPVVLVAGLLLMPLLHFAIPVRQLIEFPWNMLGVVPLAFGIFLNLAADALLKRHETTVKPFQESASLVTAGVYGLSRHPMYLGFVLILLGVGLLLGSVTPFIVIVASPFVLDPLYIRVEEGMLSARFGKEWTAYSRKVRRWI